MKTLNWKYLLAEVFFLIFGLFLALQLNDWSDRRKLKIRKNTALQNIRTEIEANKEELNGNGNNDELLTLAGDIYPLQADQIIPDPGYLILELSPPDMDTLQQKHPKSIYVHDSTSFGNIFRYRVQLNFELNIANLSDLAWETTKLGALMDKFSFDCTKGILPAYQIQEKFGLQQDKMVDVYAGQDIPGFLIQIFFWNEYHRALNEEYDLALEALENCP